MAEGVKSAEEKAAEARRGPPIQRRGPAAGIGVPVEKAMNFRGSAMRLLGMLRPDRALLLGVFVMTSVSVALTAVGPLILARATDLIFAGVFSARLEPGTTQEQAVAGLRERGNDTLADILAAMDYVVPGQGIDFPAVGDVLMLALALYVMASLLAWAQGRLLVVVVNRAVFGLRRSVEEKLNRLPLPYFDSQPRGEVLSRVTNDIDNVAQSLQQSLSQLL
ncbi:MAG: ABC transporter transmembrane domain-containing protein, partial [Ornithinimicrobium sp.]